MTSTADFDINGILAQLFRSGPTDAEKQQAASQAFTRFGLGVLAGNQPSRDPRNASGILGQAGMAGQDAWQGSLDKQQAERKANAANALQAFQLKKSFDQQQALENLFGPQGAAPQQAPAPMAGGLSPNSAAAIGAPWAARPPQPAPAPQGAPGGYRDIPPGVMQRLAASGVNVEPFLKIQDRAQPKGENIPGVGLVNPYSGAIQASFPRITESGRAAGLLPDGQGGFRVQVPQGSLEAYAGFQNADERAKATMDPYMGQVDPSGRPIPQTRAQFVDRISPQAAATAPAAAGTPAGMGPTPTQRSAAEAVGKNDAERVTALEQKVPALVSTLRRLDRMEGLTGDATYSAAGAEIKSSLGSIAQAFGLPIQKEKTGNTEEYIAHVAELLKDKLASKDYGSGNGISNLDLIAASKPLPELAKTEQGRRQIIQAIRSDTQRSMNDAIAAREHFGTNGSLRNFRYPSETERAPIPKQPGAGPTQPVMTSLPPAAQHRGKTVVGSDGIQLRSDGMRWNPVNK